LAVIQETIVPGGGAATIDFTSIPSSYRVLQLHWVGQTENAAAQNLNLRFNNDSGNNYFWGAMEIAGSSTGGPINAGVIGVLSATGDASPVAGLIYINYYAGTTWNKIARGEWSGQYGAAVRLGSADVIWLNAAAVTQVTLFGSVSNIKVGSTFILYGIA
jgi:hypothetical protein